MDVETIVRRSAEVVKADWRVAPGYDYYQRDYLNNGQTKTYHVLMISGSPYQMLVSVNGEPLSPEQKAEEQRNLEETIAQRRAESPQQRAQRVAQYERDRRRDHRLLEQFVYAFNFRLLGEQQLGSHSVYVVQARPRPGYSPPNRDTEVLTGMKGRLWIDTKTFQWVKGEAVVVRPVWIEGFLAQVEKGTRFEMEFAPVSGDIWEMSHFQMKSHARVLFLFPVSSQEDESYYGYRKATAALLEEAKADQ